MATPTVQPEQPTTNRSFQRLNPVTGEVATTAPAATVADAIAACDKAAAGFPA